MPAPLILDGVTMAETDVLRQLDGQRCFPPDFTNGGLREGFIAFKRAGYALEKSRQTQIDSLAPLEDQVLALIFDGASQKYLNGLRASHGHRPIHPV